jgi:hypothetical protein
MPLAPLLKDGQSQSHSLRPSSVRLLLSAPLAGEEVDAGSWTQLLNSWLGVAGRLGLERRARNVRSLHEVMQGAA